MEKIKRRLQISIDLCDDLIREMEKNKNRQPISYILFLFGQKIAYKKVLYAIQNREDKKIV